MGAVAATGGAGGVNAVPAPGVAGGPRVGAVAAADAAADDARRLLTAQEIDWNEVLFVDPRQAVSCLLCCLGVL